MNSCLRKGSREILSGSRSGFPAERKVKSFRLAVVALGSRKDEASGTP